MNKKSIETVLAGKIAALLVASVILFGTENAYAQMFSVQERSIENSITPERKAYIGFAPADFEFNGDEDDIVNPTRFNFDAMLIKFRYEVRTFNFFLNFGNEITGADSVSYFNFGFEFSQPLPVVNKEKFNLAVPIEFSGDFTNVSNRELTEGQGQFQQNAIDIGTGIQLVQRLSPSVRVAAKAVPNVGLSFSVGNTFVGTTYGINTGGRLYFDEIIGDFGLSLAYNYRFRRYDVDVDLFDYDLSSNNFAIGFTF